MRLKQHGKLLNFDGLVIKSRVEESYSSESNNICASVFSFLGLFKLPGKYTRKDYTPARLSKEPKRGFMLGCFFFFFWILWVAG